MNITFITVKTQFEGVHCYPDAPVEVEYLRNPHRHIFHVEAEIEVFHDDRELEFIMVKHSIENFVETHGELGSMSCEMIAKELQDHLKNLYPITEEMMLKSHYNKLNRKVNIRISEDGENGVYLREV
jgi:hypothetical protein